MDYHEDYGYTGYSHQDEYSMVQSLSLNSLPDLEYPYYHSASVTSLPDPEWDPYYHTDMAPYSYWDVISGSTSLPSLVDQQVYHVP